MATDSIPAPARAANTEDRDSAASATRRTILTAALIAPALIAPAAAAFGAISPVDASKWTAAVAAFHRADAKMKAIGVEHSAAYDRYFDEQATLGARPVAPEGPTLKFPKPIEQMTIAEIKATPNEPSAEYERYEADLAAWKAKDDDLEAAITGDVDERWEAAVSAQDDAAKAIFAEPAPDHAALSFKMGLAEEQYDGCDLDETVMRQIFADIRRLAAREA